MMKNIGHITRVLSLALFFASIVVGQETAGGIEGTIKDPNGAVVPNVTVTITTARATAAGTTTTGSGAGFRRTLTTNDEGYFRAAQIPPGFYDVVTSAASGFAEARYENVNVSLGQTTLLAIVVSTGTTTTFVDVSISDAPPVDTTNNAITTSISAQKIELLPKSTGFTGLLKSIPGTRPESRTGGSGFSVDGASGSENAFVIDGQEVTNYRTGGLNETYNIPTQLVQEVQVQSSGFNAEYGGATGGVVSVVTRGGSNGFHGEAGLQFEVPKFNGGPRPLLGRFTSGTVAAGNFVQTSEFLDAVKSEGTNVFPTASIGGPILKNRVWFYGNYSPQIFQTIVDTPYYTNTPTSRTLVATERYQRTRKYEYALGRIDASPFNNLRLTGRYLWNPVIDQGSIPATSFSNVASSGLGLGNIPTANFGGTVGILVGNDYTNLQGGRQNSNLVAVEGTYLITSKLVVNGRYSRNFLNEKLGNYFVPETVQVFSCAGTSPTHPTFPCSTTAANLVTRRDVSQRTNYEVFASYNFDAGGNHDIKGGYQRFSISNDVASGNSTIGRVSFNYGTSITTLIGLPATPGAVGSGSFRRTGTIGSGSNLNQAFYIQDRWKPIRNLTLNLGVRVESENLPTFNQFPSAINFGWGDKVAPRLGFAYDPLGSGRTKIFASYGLFYDRLKFELPRGLFGGDIFLEDYFEIFPGDSVAAFNINTILGSFTGSSVCPTTGTIAPDARSRCQRNLRVNANDPTASAVAGGAIDPNLRPFRQTEFTVGAERQVGRDYVVRVRYTYKNVDEAVEDAGVVDIATGSESYIIGNPGRGLHLQTLQNLGYQKSTRPERRYDGLEFVIEKRLTQNWYFNLNYTYSRLFGNYSGLSSSDEPHLVNGRSAPGVTRAFDLPFIGFTALGEPDNGPLQTDRPHVFNGYGAYIFDWNGSKSNSTEFSGFQTITSGQPQTTTIYGASTVTPQILYGRGDLGRSPTFTQTDFNVTHRYRFGHDSRFTMALDFNILNVWDQSTVTGIYTTLNPSTAPVNPAALGLTALTYANGYTSGALLQPILNRINSQADRSDLRYTQPHLYQSPRVVRFGARFMF
jgi:hypothetical protein